MYKKQEQQIPITIIVQFYAILHSNSDCSNINAHF